MGSGEERPPQVPLPGAVAVLVHQPRRQNLLAREITRPSADDPPTGGSGHVLIPLGSPGRTTT